MDEEIRIQDLAADEIRDLLLEEGSEPARYTVRLHFCELAEDAQPGESTGTLPLDQRLEPLTHQQGLLGDTGQPLGLFQKRGIDIEGGSHGRSIHPYDLPSFDASNAVIIHQERPAVRCYCPG